MTNQSLGWWFAGLGEEPTRAIAADSRNAVINRGTLRKFFHAHNCRSEERIQERIEGIYQATPATKDASCAATRAVAQHL